MTFSKTFSKYFHLDIYDEYEDDFFCIVIVMIKWLHIQSFNSIGPVNLKLGFAILRILKLFLRPNFKNRFFILKRIFYNYFPLCSEKKDGAGIYISPKNAVRKLQITKCIFPISSTKVADHAIYIFPNIHYITKNVKTCCKI